MNDNFFIQKTIDLATQNAKSGHGGPFAAIVVKNGEIISQAVNSVTCSHDPTAHAEVNAIREACKTLESHQLTDCIIYSSCEPCPMCLGAIYWARPIRLVFAASRQDAANCGFDDEYIYSEISKPASKRNLETKQLKPETRLIPFIEWSKNIQKLDY